MIWKGFRFAIAIISGKFIFNFGIAERLRTLRYPIFTGGVVMANGIYSACFLRKRRRGSILALSVKPCRARR